MKKLIYTLSLLFLFSTASAQVFWTEDFETDGEGIATRYTSSNVFNDGTSDHYGRTNGSNVSGGYTSPNGTFFMAGEDLDDNGGDGSPTKTTLFAPQNISGMTDVKFSGLFAEGTSGGWDSSDDLYLEYQIDGAGPWIKFMQFAAPSSGSNLGMNADSNLDGVGEGIAITNTFAEFTKSFSVSGSTIQIRLTATANSASEEFAYDYFRLEDISGAATPTITVSTTSISGLDYLFGAGPSGIDSAILSGSNLTGNITGSAITNFEFSLDKVTWGTFPGAITPFAGTVPPTTVYVRLAAGLAVGSYNETLTLSSTGATDIDVTLSGDVTLPPPDIIINEFQADPDATNGDANGDGTSSTSQDEFVELYNNEATAVDMENWTISDGFGVRHTFPAGSVVPAGGFITVFGGGTPTGISGVAQTASTGSLGLNNGGDDIFIHDDNGALVISHNYGSEGGNNQSVGRDPDFTGAFVQHTGIIALNRNFSPGELNVTPPSSCSISAISAAAPSACSPATNTYSIDITVTYTDEPATGTLDVNGQSFAITTSPQTVSLTNLTPTGADVDVTAVFSDDGTCTATEVALYTSPAPCIPPIPDCSEVFFSEYIEGTASNKCYELYNPTPNAIDLAAGGYEVAVFGNGATIYTPIALTGTIPAYGTFVVCNSFADTAFTNRADVVGGALNPSTFYNGNDVLALFKGGTVIDAIGQVGSTSVWANGGVSTSDQTIIRNANVKAGDNVEDDAFDPSIEFTSLGLDVATNLGIHVNDCAPFIWTGNTDTDWGTATNWNKNTVPTATDTILIPTTPEGGVFPIASQTITAADLTIETSASLNMAPTYGLVISGSVTNNGTVTLESDASGTAYLDDFTNPGATFTGDITVQTFVSVGSGLGQRLFGSPVNNGVVQGLDATYTGYPLGQLIPTATCDPTQLDPSSPYSNLFEWNENATYSLACYQEGWTAISAASTLTNGRGYSGWMNDGSVISFTGTPNTGTVTFATSGNSGSGVANAEGWHLLANPYPSPLAVDAILNSGFTSPQIYNGGSGPYSGSYSPMLVSGDNVAVMQGFVAESTGGTVFTTNQTDRVAGNEQWLRPEFTHLLTIDVAGNNMADKTYIYFDDETDAQFNAAGDCKKRDSDYGHPNLYTLTNGIKYSLNGLSSTEMTTSVAMNFTPGTSGTYTITRESLESFPATSLIFLEDKLTNSFTNLREAFSYTFDATTNDIEDRFVIHFTSPVSVTTTEASCEGNDASITVDFGNHQINNQTITWDYDLRLNNVSLNNEVNQSNIQTINELPKGNYELILNHGNYSTSMLINVDGKEIVDAAFTAPTTIETGESFNAINTSLGATNYSWSIDNQTFNTTDLEYIFTLGGVYELILAASNNDCADDETMLINVSERTTSIGNPIFENVQVYSTGKTIVIEVENVQLDNAHLAVFNVLGQTITSSSIEKTKSTIVIPNESGYYFVKIRLANKENTYKVFIQ